MIEIIGLLAVFLLGGCCVVVCYSKINNSPVPGMSLVNSIMSSNTHESQMGGRAYADESATTGMPSLSGSAAPMANSILNKFGSRYKVITRSEMCRLKNIPSNRKFILIIINYNF